MEPAPVKRHAQAEQPELCVFPDSVRNPDSGGNHAGIIYRSRSIHELVNKAIAFARSSATVLITGENGTGKELFARLIHEASRRSDSRFGQVNCAALSESLTESELFGHEKGAFTGADRTRIGRFEWAQGGTLLLDEISEVPVSTQAKLLRLLEENEFQRVGSNETFKSDVRVIATSNRDLTELVEQGLFREDLFYRLNVLRIHLPPLRDRPEDIPLLANHFMLKYRNESIAEISGFDKKALSRICNYAWPGNVRQLRNVVLSSCVIARQPEISENDLPEMAVPAKSDRYLADWMYETSLEEIERRVIMENLKRANGNKTVVAGILGVTTRTLANKIKLYRQQGLISLQPS